MTKQVHPVWFSDVIAITANFLKGSSSNGGLGNISLREA